MAGPGLFLLLCLLLFVTVAVMAVVLRLRTRAAGGRSGSRSPRPAARGLQAQAGDPLGLGPVLSARGRRMTVERTVSGLRVAVDLPGATSRPACSTPPWWPGRPRAPRRAGSGREDCHLVTDVTQGASAVTGGSSRPKVAGTATAARAPATHGVVPLGHE